MILEGHTHSENLEDTSDVLLETGKQVAVDVEDLPDAIPTPEDTGEVIVSEEDLAKDKEKKEQTHELEPVIEEGSTALHTNHIRQEHEMSEPDPEFSRGDSEPGITIDLSRLDDVKPDEDDQQTRPMEKATEGIVARAEAKRIERQKQKQLIIETIQKIQQQIIKKGHEYTLHLAGQQIPILINELQNMADGGMMEFSITCYPGKGQTERIVLFNWMQNVDVLVRTPNSRVDKVPDIPIKLETSNIDDFLLKILGTI